VTVALDDTESQAPESVVALASWSARAGAIGLDAVTPVVVALVVCAAAFLYDSVWWVYAAVASVALLVIAVCRWWLPAAGGWSPGRAVFAIRVQRADDGADAGLGRLVLRDLAHLLDTAVLLVGWLRPLWDARHRTFADILVQTEVRVVAPPKHDVRRRAGAALLVATVLCLGAVGAGAWQFWQDRTISQAREQISAQGPRIVEKVLSYSAETYKDDFAKAQSLVTDSYRDQLVHQQQLISKGGVSTNDYWAVSSTVLGADAHRATMLVALQGQRGADPRTLKFITATVRVTFVKSPTGVWQLSDLTVLKRPQPMGQQISSPQPPVSPAPPKPAPAAAPAPPAGAKPPAGGTR
jgi:Mce-associated membrane protein